MEIDISRLVERIAELQISKIIFTPGYPCTPWSRLSTNPLGFNHPLAQLVVKTAERLDVLRSRNLIWKVLNETVVPHEQLYQDIGCLEKMTCMDYLMHNAVHCGAVASRPRLLGLEGAEVSKIPTVSHFNPDFVLDNGWHFTKRLVSCLVAVGDDTSSHSCHCHWPPRQHSLS